MTRKSNHERQHETEESFAKAAWEGFVETEVEGNVRVEIQLVPTNQRGVFFVGVTAWSLRAGDQARKVASIQGSYPNGRSMTLSAYLFGLANSLGQMVEAVRAEQERSTQASF
jgi:hypothetical protein